MRYSFIVVTGVLVATSAVAITPKDTTGYPAENPEVAESIMRKLDGFKEPMEDLNTVREWFEQATYEMSESDYGTAHPEVVAEAVLQAKEVETSTNTIGNWLGSVRHLLTGYITGYESNSEDEFLAYLETEAEPTIYARSNAVKESKKPVSDSRRRVHKAHKPVRNPAQKPKTFKPASKPVKKPKTAKPIGRPVMNPKATKPVGKPIRKPKPLKSSEPNRGKGSGKRPVKNGPTVSEPSKVYSKPSKSHHSKPGNGSVHNPPKEKGLTKPKKGREEDFITIPVIEPKEDQGRKCSKGKQTLEIQSKLSHNHI
jgi:hypothetical protein